MSSFHLSSSLGILDGLWGGAPQSASGGATSAATGATHHCHCSHHAHAHSIHHPHATAFPGGNAWPAGVASGGGSVTAADAAQMAADKVKILLDRAEAAQSAVNDDKMLATSLYAKILNAATVANAAAMAADDAAASAFGRLQGFSTA